MQSFITITKQIFINHAVVNHICGRCLQLHCHATLLLAGNCGKKNITYTLSIAWPHPFSTDPIRSSRILHRSDAAPISSRRVGACERGAFNLHKVVIGQSKWRTIFQIIDDTQQDRGILSVPLMRRKPVSFVRSSKKKKNERRGAIYTRDLCSCSFCATSKV